MAKAKTTSEPSVWSAFEWHLYQEWATELGYEFEDVQRRAGVKPPSEGSRSSAWRAEHGGAPRVRRAIYEQLVKLEKAAEHPSKLGEIALGVEEWNELGQQMAMHAGGFVFLRVLQIARQALADATGRPVVGARPKRLPKGAGKSKTAGESNDPPELVAVPAEAGGRKRR